MTNPEPSAVVGQVLTFAGKLSEALSVAEPFGGLAGLRPRMKASTAARIAEELELLRGEIDEQLEALNRPDPRPARRTPLRRQANKPDPIHGER